MEANQHLSKYARKQLRLAEEKNFGTDYTKQIEQSQEISENHEVNTCADRAIQTRWQFNRSERADRDFSQTAC